MDKICRFICVNVSVSVCNLKCKYCYLQHYDYGKFGTGKFGCDPGTFRKSMSKERLGGICMFNFTASGETLINPLVIDYVRGILEEGHYVEIVTNATITKSFEAISQFPKDLLDRLMLKCSFHFMELKEKGLLELFFKNVRMIRDAGASFTVELMPCDELLPYRNEILELTIKELGAPCHLTVGRDASCPRTLPLLTKLSREEYEEAWSMFDSELFRYKLSVFGVKQHGFCYAGDWMSVLDLGTGMVSQCYCGYRGFNAFKDINKPLPFKAIGKFCREAHCFNAHAWLTFGCMPSSYAPYYDEVRNRECLDGSEWLRPKFKAFVHQKFYENNKIYSNSKMNRVNAEMSIRRILVVLLGGMWRTAHKIVNSGKSFLQGN